jgi:DNA-directed RNA polymerase subunit K/omega
MLYPSIQELLTATAKDGEEKLNKYSVVMATAKCARIITNEYIEQRHVAEKKVANKETDKDISALINKDYRDEKAVKNALREMNEGKFDVFLPGDEGYDESIVEVTDYAEPKEEFKPFKLFLQENKESSSANFSDFDSAELMNADEVYTEEDGFSVAEAEDVE